MPAYSQSDEALSTKLLTFFPRNTDRPTHHALIVLFNCQTGVPMAVSNLSLSLCVSVSACLSVFPSVDLSVLVASIMEKKARFAGQ